MKSLSTNIRRFSASSGWKLALAAATVAVVAITTLPTTADAGIRVRAKIRTPHVNIGVRTHPKVHRNVHRQRHVVRRPHRQVYVYPAPYDRIPPRFDRKIAKRLAQRTAYTPRNFMQMRRAGYTWREIGRSMHIRPIALRRAMAPYMQYAWRAQPGYVYETCERGYGDN